MSFLMFYATKIPVHYFYIGPFYLFIFFFQINNTAAGQQREREREGVRERREKEYVFKIEK